MSTWNYRIVRYRDGSGYGLHEVYYDDDGKPWGMTAEPATFACEIGEEPTVIMEALETARRDSSLCGMFDEPEMWPGKNPSTPKPPRRSARPGRTPPGQSS